MDRQSKLLARRGRRRRGREELARRRKGSRLRVYKQEK